MTAIAEDEAEHNLARSDDIGRTNFDNPLKIEGEKSPSLIKLSNTSEGDPKQSMQQLGTISSGNNYIKGASEKS